ncbi:MAG: tyrosine-type recombinase/integrase, partial [Candidatus Eisenbacteria bacterium]|nr:tyrosine-type recombinase/integrase [Candidatus Eisenbacteria bacterium]
MNASPQAAPSRDLLARWLRYLAVERNLSLLTTGQYEREAIRLRDWLEACRGRDMVNARTEDLSRFLGDLARSGLARASQRRAFAAIRSFYGFACAEGLVAVNPAAVVALPKMLRNLPKVLTVQGVESVLAQPDVTTPLGLRDRAMLELLYSAGLRASECLSLRVADASMAERMVRVLGKGAKVRIVPFGAVAHRWLLDYLERSRPALQRRPCEWLFLTQRGTRVSRITLW